MGLNVTLGSRPQLDPKQMYEILTQKMNKNKKTNTRRARLHEEGPVDHTSTLNMHLDSHTCNILNETT